MTRKIKSIAECGMSPTYFFEVGKRYPFPKGSEVTEIREIKEEAENKLLTGRRYEIYNHAGLLAEFTNCPAVVIYDQTEE